MFKIKQDLPFNWINTDKFKDMIISIRFAVENVEPNVSMNNILSYMMSDRSEMYPSKQLDVKSDGCTFRIESQQ